MKSEVDYLLPKITFYLFSNIKPDIYFSISEKFLEKTF